MSEMVERLARAIRAVPVKRTEMIDSDGAVYDLEYRVDWEAMARAAIAAMRECSGDMTTEGAEAINPYVSDPTGFEQQCEIALDCWTAMIDEALR